MPGARLAVALLKGGRIFALFGAMAAGGCGRTAESIGSIAEPDAAGARDVATGTATGDGDSSDVPEVATGPRTPLIPEWNCGPTCYRAPEVPAAPDPAARFAGPADAAAADKPVIIYPLTGAMYPVNLSDLTVHWRRTPGAMQRLFRIRATGVPGPADVHFDFLVPCQAPPGSIAPEECVYSLPPGAWLDALGRNRGQRLDIVVSAVDSAPGRNNQVASSDGVRLTVSPDSLGGGLYYWSTKLRGTLRLLFGARKAQPFITPDSSANPTDCGGCHSVSLNGNVIAFTAGAAEGSLVATSAANPSAPFFPVASAPDSTTIALNPDGTRALVVFQRKLVVHDTSDGQVISTVDPALYGDADRAAYHPDWSPDGRAIVVTLASQAENDYTVRNGSIAVLAYDAGVFGAARVIAPDSTGDFNYYPTWSPDGKWIAFASSKVTVGRSSYSQPASRLRLVARDGGRIYELTRATNQADRTSTWPKFAPYSQSNGNILFITFNSKIDYGYLLKNSAIALDSERRAQLWLTEIDIRELPTGDPSRAPIWLPFQDLEQSNHLAYWTQRLGCPPGGVSTGCAEDETCDNEGYCKRPIP
jgi:hypothetical protein